MNNLEKIFNPHSNLVKEIYFYIFDKLMSKEGLKIELDKKFFSINTEWDNDYNEKKQIRLNQENSIDLFLNKKIIDFQHYEIDILNHNLLLEIFTDRNGLIYDGLIYDRYSDTFKNSNSLFFNFPLFDNERIIVEFNKKEIYNNFQLVNQKFLDKISEEKLYSCFIEQNKIIINLKLINFSNNHKIFNEQCIWFDNNNDIILKTVDFCIKNEYLNIDKESFLCFLKKEKIDEFLKNKDVFEIFQYLSFVFYYYETFNSYEMGDELKIIEEELNVIKDLYNNLKKINS